MSDYPRWVGPIQGQVGNTRYYIKPMREEDFAEMLVKLLGGFRRGAHDE